MRKFNTMIVALAGGLVSLPAWSADSYTIDPRHTFPIYEISHFGWSTQRGRFDKTSGKIVLDRAAKTGSVDVTVDAASVDTGVDKLNEHLASADFFNVAKFPTIVFQASNIVFDGDTPASVPGEITILGVTKPATLTITRFSCGQHPMLKKEVCGADASTTIKRSEFGMTKYVPALGDEVNLLINVESIKD
jgi:polyisoprenoid-binding protein YceI